MKQLYRITIYLFVMCFFQSELKSQTFRLEACIKEQLWCYLYQKKEVANPKPPFYTEPLYYESGETFVNNDYMEIKNLITRETIVNNEDLEEIGIYSFLILHRHPETIYIFLKYREEIEVLYIPTLGIENYLERYDAMIEIQLQQLVDHFKKHPDIEKHLLSVYSKKVSAIYDYNVKYKE